MELSIAVDFGSFLRADAFAANENRSESYIHKKEEASSRLANRKGSGPGQLMSRRRKSYYTKLLEMLVRKTESERRMEIFGSDPFR